MNRLLHTLEQRAQHQPDDIVLRGDKQQVSAVSLMQQLNSLSSYLNILEAKVIGLYADNSPDWVIVDLACQQANIILVPIPVFFSPSQIKHIVTSASIDTLIYSQATSHTLQSALPALKQSDTLANGLLLASLLSDKKAKIPANTAKITFTSGSTGTPKGVCLSTQQCINVALSLQQAIAINTPQHLCLLPLSTLLENIGGIYMPLLADGCVTILSSSKLGMFGSSDLEVTTFLNALGQHHPNTLIVVPQLLTVLDQALQSGWSPPSSLKFVAVGGARVSTTVIKRTRDFGLPVFEGYGLSECASVVALNTPMTDQYGSSGKVLSHLTVEDINGEILVTGNTFLGYLNQTDSWGMSSVSTGDIGSVDEHGFITISGRSKNQLISSFGRNISPEWIESELLANDMFKQAVVVGDGKPCCSALLFTGAKSPTRKQIQCCLDQINTQLPDYARVGHWLQLQEPFTTINGLLTENGRPRRANIIEKFSKQIDQLYSNQEALIIL